MEEAEIRKEADIQSNNYRNWPVGPKIGAESAYLFEADSGTVLYEKNIHAKLYPASITKLLTALIVVDKCSLDERVYFSKEVIDSIDWKSDANLGISAGTEISVEECLYGLLVGSANEAALALARHITGSDNIKDFADIMNQYARQYGCVDSNFVTPNGMHDDNHYTSAYDMGLIAKQFFDNPLLAKISGTTSYHIKKSPTQPRENCVVTAKSKLFPGREYGYDNLVGTKTGYTSLARQTLVSCADNGSMKLICIVLKEENPFQYSDTIELFKYGYNNFVPAYSFDNDSTYNIETKPYAVAKDLFGNSNALFTMDKNSKVFIPVGASFQDLTSKITYNENNSNELARINYYYYDNFVGYSSLTPTENSNIYNSGQKENTNTYNNRVVVNISHIIIILLLVNVIATIIFRIVSKNKKQLL